jgi:hypothetical protein
MDLSAVAGGAGGFVINGDSTSSKHSGYSVSAAGDVNGDGLADLIVGAPDAKSGGGRSYVVFGKTSGKAMTLSAVAGGAGGFVINGDSSTEENSGFSVSAAGDVNGDGLADLIVGAWAANGFGGRSYVVFGKTTGTAMDLSAVARGTGGFVINGDSASYYSGNSVSAAGDVNGDGLADLIVGAYAANSNGGRSYVVFGRTTGTAMDLSAVAGGTGGFVINGDSRTWENSGFSVSAAGDVNGDGLADLIVGAHAANSDGGRSYVVFGKTTGTVDLSAVAGGAGGFVINGDSTSSKYSGYSVSAAGDVNGDGLADLIVGAYAANGYGGRSYVIFGNTSGAFGQTMVNWMGTDAADTQSDGGVAQTLVAGAGNDNLTATAASVLYGGAGNDSFTIDSSSMITALQNPMGSGGNVDRLARIDGGSGIDKVVLTGSGLTFDLTQVANQAASNPDGGSRMDSVEIFDITGSGNNMLKLTAKDVLELGSANLFAKTGRQQVLVKGNAGDTVDLAEPLSNTAWKKGSNITLDDGIEYLTYNYSNTVTPAWVTVYVQNGMTVL